MNDWKSKRSAEYAAKLKDPRWQKKRLEILNRDNFTCQACKSTEKTLHVHHHFYSKGCEPWEYMSEALQTLCEDCHQYETDCRPEAEQALNMALRVAGVTVNDLVELSNALTRHYRDANTKRLVSEVDNLLLLKEIPDALLTDLRALFIKYAEITHGRDPAEALEAIR